MKVQTFSIVVGTKACNAKCPFCISRMTGFEPVIGKSTEINERNFEKACRLALLNGATTVLMTGKGEPTLYPQQISDFLRLLRSHSFPLIEMQTNAMLFGQLARDETPDVKALTSNEVTGWYESGLNTIAISAVDTNNASNQSIYGKKYGDLPTTVDYLHEVGFSVRLCIMMQNPFVNSPKRVDEIVADCKRWGVEQLTVQPIRTPKTAKDGDVAAFTKAQGLSPDEESEIANHIRKDGTLLRTLMHGAEIYDLYGQNVCLFDCLTFNGLKDQARTLIFYPDGRLMHDWQYEGAVILGGKHEKRRVHSLPLVSK